jgi:DNA processing protein
MRKKIEAIVAHGGLVISEFKLGCTPQNFTFPQRNRIIAGLSDFLFIPEAGTRSGSLITADFAFKMQKPIYAPPNSLFESNHAGIHEWCSKGKIKSCYDIGSLVNKYFKTKITRGKPHTNTPPNHLSPSEQIVLNYIQLHKNCSLTEIIHHAKLPESEIILSLTQLEIQNLIQTPHP